uniref:THAP-type domain-containing protein n=1 Tax=Eptatretus burgeri TaxID=7764 RepID=A0A8C4QM89_EPTBU
MPRCAAWGCPNRQGQGITFHRFPRNAQRRQVWEAKVRRKDWKACDNSFLCKAHFEDNQYEKHRADNLHKLKANAIPTIFANQVHNSRKSPRRKQHVRSDDLLVDDEWHSWETLEDADEYRNGNLNGKSVDTNKEVRPWKNTTTMALNNQYSTFCNLQPSDKHHDGSTVAQQDYTDFHFELEVPNTTASGLPALAATAVEKTSICQPHQQVDPLTQEILTQLRSHSSKKIMELQRELTRARQHDTDDLYLLSLAPDVKSLKPEAKSLFKIRVQLLLHELKYGGKTNQTIHYSPNISHSTSASPVEFTFTPTASF